VIPIDPSPSSTPRAALEKGNFLITSDIIGDLFRNSMKGSSPGNNVFADFMWKIIGWVSLSRGALYPACVLSRCESLIDVNSYLQIGIPIWSTMCDANVKKFGQTQLNAQ